MSTDKERYGYERHGTGAQSAVLAASFVTGVVSVAGSVAAICIGLWYGWLILPVGLIALVIGAVPLNDRALGAWRALRYSIPLSRSKTAYSLYLAGLRDLMKSSPRAAVVSHLLSQLDNADFSENYEKNLRRFTPARERIWGFFSALGGEDYLTHPSVGMAGPLRFLDSERKPWSDVDRLVDFAFALSKNIAGRDEADAVLIGELTAAWYDSGQGIEEAVALFIRHGADVTKLLFQGVPLEYAVEMTRPVDTKAW